MTSVLQPRADDDALRPALRALPPARPDAREGREGEDERRRSRARVLLVGGNAALLGLLLLGRGPTPVLVAAGLAALAIAWVIAIPRGTRLEGLAQLFVFLIYGNVLVVASLYHGVPNGIVAMAYALPLIPALAASLRRQPLVLTAALPWVLAYTAVLLLSSAFAARPAATIPHIGNFLTEGLVLYLLVTNAFRTPDALHRVIWVLIAAAVAMASLTLYQELTQAYDNDFLGFAQITDQVFSVGETIDGKVLRGRLSGPLGEPNRYAQVLVVVLPLAVVRALRSPRRVGRVVAAMSSALILAGILLTFSRGAVVALALVAAAMVALRLIRTRHVVALLVGFVVVLVLFTPDYAVRLQSLAGLSGQVLQGSQAEDGAVLGRATSNLASLHVFLDHPLLGVGPLQYFERYSQDYANELGLAYFEGRRRGHNLYFETAADTGLLGLVTLLAVPLVTGRRLRRAARRLEADHPDLSALADSMLLMLLGYFATAAFLHLSYQRYMWLFLGLAGAAAVVLGREGASEDEQPPVRRRRRPARPRRGAPRRGPGSSVVLVDRATGGSSR